VCDYAREVTSPGKFQIGLESDERSRCHVGATYTGPVTVIFSFLFSVFLFFNRATAHTREPIFAHNSSKDAIWYKEDPFRDEKCVILKFGGVLP